MELTVFYFIFNVLMMPQRFLCMTLNIQTFALLRALYSRQLPLCAQSVRRSRTGEHCLSMKGMSQQ